MVSPRPILGVGDLWKVIHQPNNLGGRPRTCGARATRQDVARTPRPKKCIFSHFFAFFGIFSLFCASLTHCEGVTPTLASSHPLCRTSPILSEQFEAPLVVSRPPPGPRGWPKCVLCVCEWRSGTGCELPIRNSIPDQIYIPFPPLGS